MSYNNLAKAFEISPLFRQAKACGYAEKAIN